MCDSSQDQRARRIPDQEWDAWREKLVRLYVEDGLSRNEIIEIMANDHGFVINDTQLKHRFRRWNVKKNIPDSDMATMLYFWREGKAIGKNLRFLYRGRELEDERIERASKRRKISFSPPTLTPSYIKAYTSRHSSPQSPRNAIVIDQGSAAVEISEHYLDSVARSGLDLPHRLGVADGTAEIIGEVWLDDHDIPCIELIEAHEQSNPFQTRELGQTSCDIEASQLSKMHSSRFPPAQQSVAASARSFRPAYRSLSKSPTVPGDNNAHHQQLMNTTFLRADSLRRSLSTTSHTEVQSNLSYILQDIDPSTLVLPLQLIKSFFVKDLYTYIHSRCRSNNFKFDSTNFRSGFLHHFGQDGWFELEFENLVRWSCDSYAKAGRKVLTTRKAQNDLLDKEIDESSKQQESISSCSWSLPKLKAKRTGYCVFASPVGVFRATLSALRYQEAGNDSQDNPHTLDIAFMPADNKRARGLYVTFLRAANESAGPRISPHIKAINILPRDSEIFHCIRMNDLQSVRKFFERGEAAPTDVDEEGFSLFTYSLRMGDCDVFRLLLQSGADTQNCKCYTNSLDLIWTIWKLYLGFCFPSPLRGRHAPYSFMKDFDQCVSMTNAALEYGCDINETLPYNPSLPNALFKIFIDVPYATRREEALKYLLKIGYDMEQRAEDGETLLLHGVTALSPENIKCLKILMEKGANIHAIDAEGRSALHCAFLAPGYLRADKKLSYWEGAPEFMFNNGNPDPEYFLNRFDIDDEKYAEGYEDLRRDLDALGGNKLTARYTSRCDPLLISPNRDHMSKMDCRMDVSDGEFQTTSNPILLGDGSQRNADQYYPNIDDSYINDLFGILPSSTDKFQDSTSAIESVAYAGTSSRVEQRYASSESRTDESDRPASDFRPRDNKVAEESIACANTSSETTQHHKFICPNRKMRRVMEILKKHLRFKFLILLQGGCDPNVLDNKDESPGDLAERLGLWPQWEWALVSAGYDYDSANQRWFKSQVI